MPGRKARSRIALALAAAAFAACLGACCMLASMHSRASFPQPSPLGTSAREGAAPASDPFPTVDWDYWLSVNEDVVGWVTVPGTGIDQPIVQADPADPQYYLWHDVYREPNYLGCPYIDADCPQGFDSPNCVVFGHNMGGDDQSMFGDFELFSDAGFAAEHRSILIQTPTRKIELEARCVEVAAGWEATNCTSFETPAEFQLWYEERVANSAVVLDGATPDSVITFCTCSYGYWSNERTLVIAAQKGSRYQTESSR